MAATTWITNVQNQTSVALKIMDGENSGINFILGPNHNTAMNGFPFPWVDTSKPNEINKAIEIIEGNDIVGRLFQCWNDDTLKWLHPYNSPVASAIPVQGDAATGGSRTVNFTQDAENNIVVTVLYPS